MLTDYNMAHFSFQWKSFVSYGLLKKAQSVLSFLTLLWRTKRCILGPDEYSTREGVEKNFIPLSLLYIFSPH